MAEGRADQAKGFGVAGLLVGLAAGAAAYAVTQVWMADAADRAAPAAVLVFIMAGAASFLLLAERAATLGATAPALAIGALLAAPSYFMARALFAEAGIDPFAPAFWFAVAGPLAGLLATTLAKAALVDGFRLRYATVFFHGLTLPLIGAGAALIAGLSVVLLFAWAELLKGMGFEVFHRVLQESAVIMPVAGAIGGLAIGMIRGFDSALGSLRFFALLFCRIAMPITAVFSLTFALVLLVNGPGPIYALPLPGHLMLALAFAGMLIFNGVYQNGEGGAPPAWLRIATVVSLATFPVYAGLSASVVWTRAAEYGLTPARVVGLVANGLAAAYSVVCVAGLLSELRLGARRWMPLVAPLNIAMAGLWVAVLVALGTPLIDPWAISARNQERRLLSGEVSAAEFDFSYLKASLGEPGRRALMRLAAAPETAPDARAIRVAAEAALADAPAFTIDGSSADGRRRAASGARADEEANAPGAGGEIDSLPLSPLDPSPAAENAPAAEDPER